jgi:hypothetical protein
VDGYVVSTRLSRCFRGDSIDGFVGEEIEQALKDYDCPVRRKSSIKVIKEARWAGKLLVTTSVIKNWLMKKVIRYSPPSFVVKELIKGDKSNQMFLEMMDKDLKAQASKSNENGGGADIDDCQQTSSSVES